MLHLNNYFENIDNFPLNTIFKDVQNPWEPVSRLKECLKDFLAQEEECTVRVLDGIRCQSVTSTTGQSENILYVEKPVRIEKNILLFGVLIMKGTVLEPGALIKAPAVIGRNCQVRHGAYLRGNVFTGDSCVLGHTTEIKNSVFFNGVEAGHFAYIGDSILGTSVNLGAGTKLANLQFRTWDNKVEKKNKTINIHVKGKKYNTSMRKLGAIIGDYSEIGCNTVTSPGSFIAKKSWIYPNTTVGKGFYPPDSIIKTAGHGLEVVSNR